MHHRLLYGLQRVRGYYLYLTHLSVVDYVLCLYQALGVDHSYGVASSLLRVVLLLLLLLTFCVHPFMSVEEGQMRKHIRADIALEADVRYSVLQKWYRYLTVLKAISYRTFYLTVAMGLF